MVVVQGAVGTDPGGGGAAAVPLTGADSPAKHKNISYFLAGVDEHFSGHQNVDVHFSTASTVILHNFIFPIY